MHHVRDTSRDLSTTRIVRVLRSLRTKCEALSSYSPSKSNVLRTYARASVRQSMAPKQLVNVDVSSLTRIPPLEQINPVKYDMDVFQLCKRIHEVRDAFRNVVHLCLGKTSFPHRRFDVQQDNRPTGRVLGLAAMCSTLVGEHIEAEVEVARETKQTVSSFEDEDISVITELYDAIPIPYRRHAAISHTLSIILSTCPHYPTLICSLLETTTIFGLSRESEVLLEVLFASVFSPSPSSTVDTVYDKANSHYLTSLYNKHCSGECHVSPQAFIRILNGALADVCCARGPDVWTCPTVSRFMKFMPSRHLPAFMDMCTGLYQCILAYMKSGRNGAEVGCTLDLLWTLLAESLQASLPYLIPNSEECSNTNVADNIHSVSEFLEHVAASGLDFSALKPEDALGMKNAVASIAVCCLSSTYRSALCLSGENVLVKMLSGIEPNGDTYLTLIRAVYPSKSNELTPPPTINEWETYISSLRTHSLYAHEAAVWSSILRHVESLAFRDDGGVPHPYRSLLLSMRSALVERVEEAEHLRFTAGLASTSQLNNDVVRKVVDPEADWRWEDLAGCWVRRTPVVPRKRKRLHSDCGSPVPKRRLEMKRSSLDQWASSRRRDISDKFRCGRSKLGCYREVASSSSLRKSFAESKYTATSISASNHNSSSRSASNRKRSYSLESTPPSSPEPPAVDQSPHFKKKPSFSRLRRVSNFTSILADAQMNRVVLHESDSEDEVGLLGSPAPNRSDHHDLSENDQPVRGICSAEQLSSDDLNLFAYPSSPIKR